MQGCLKVMRLMINERNSVWFIQFTLDCFSGASDWPRSAKLTSFAVVITYTRCFVIPRTHDRLSSLCLEKMLRLLPGHAALPAT
jgi:hypothetical protein